MDIKAQVLNEMRNPDIYRNEVVSYVEKRIPYVFGVACEKGLSINDWQPDATFGDQLGQKTVLITVRMFDLWETAIIDVLNNALKKLKVKVAPAHDAVGDMKVIFPNGEETRWEIKTSQASDSFTGATHSASKCNNYILINYSIDKSRKLTFDENKNKGFIQDLAVFVWDGMEAKWAGKPTEHSSFTTLKIPAEIFQKRPEIIVLGSLQPRKKWCGFVRESGEDYNHKKSQSKL